MRRVQGPMRGNSNLFVLRLKLIFLFLHPFDDIKTLFPLKPDTGTQIILRKTYFYRKLKNS